MFARRMRYIIMLAAVINYDAFLNTEFETGR